MVIEISNRRCGVWVDEITAKCDVRSNIAVDGVVRFLLKQQVDRIHGPQTDHHTLALHLATLFLVSVVRHGLHLHPVLHQHDRQHLLRELSHSEREVVRTRQATSKTARIWVEVITDVD